MVQHVGRIRQGSERRSRLAAVVMHSPYSKNTEPMLNIHSATCSYMNFMFDLEDASTDGTIDAQEFAIVCSSYGLDTQECEQAFAKMSKVRTNLQARNSPKYMLSIIISHCFVLPATTHIRALSKSTATSLPSCGVSTSRPTIRPPPATLSLAKHRSNGPAATPNNRIRPQLAQALRFRCSVSYQSATRTRQHFEDMIQLALNKSSC